DRPAGRAAKRCTRSLDPPAHWHRPLPAVHQRLWPVEPLCEAAGTGMQVRSSRLHRHGRIPPNRAHSLPKEGAVARSRIAGAAAIAIVLPLLGVLPASAAAAAPANPATPANTS